MLVRNCGPAQPVGYRNMKRSTASPSGCCYKLVPWEVIEVTRSIDSEYTTVLRVLRVNMIQPAMGMDSNGLFWRVYPHLKHVFL